MNAPYYNAEPGARSIDEMFWELEEAREEEIQFEDRFDGSWGEFAAETSDDIDDAYDREQEGD